MFRQFPLFVILLIAISCASIPDYAQSERISTVVARAAKEKFWARSAVVAKLQKKGDLPALYALAQSDVVVSSQASAAIVDLLATHAAIAYCRTLPVISANWKEAASALTDHPKDKVIHYFLEIAQNEHSWARAFLYRVFPSDWCELEAFAKKDENNPTPYIYFNAFRPSNTVGDEARDYLNRIAKHREKSTG